MKCLKCQFDNREGAKFCKKCGAKLEMLCPSCGSPYDPDSVFCDECGHNLTPLSEPIPKALSFDEKIAKIQRYLPKGLTDKILSQRDRIEGERKQVTVMFCDMEGFTGLSEKTGPEEVFSIMDQVYEILIHKVHDYEGTVNEMTGDGIMALFGAPIALEDAPQRAIRSALAIHREMSKFSDKLKQEKEGMPPLKMRIGIHTGPVVVGTLGNDLRVEFKAVGDTVNLASRIEGLADPGTTCITSDTFRLTEGFFRFENQGRKEVKGKAEPVNVYQVIAPSSMRTRFDVSTDRGLTPFVGRDRELELLLDCFERAKGGRGQACSIMAEAGLGKSRLLYEFRKAVANEEVTFLEGKCLSYSQGVPYHLQIDFLKANFDIREGEGDLEIREKVRRGLRVLGADEASTLPYLLDLLSLKDSVIDDIVLSPEARKARIIDAFKQIVLKGSEIRPLILAHEDLHWVDKSSEDLLIHILESIPGARVFFIFTYRPDFVHTWGGKSYHSQVTLNRLSNRESLSMVAHILGTEDLKRDLEELILEKTEGVPFFIEEFLKSLKDLNIIERKGKKYCLTKNIKDLAIPSAIQDVIMARVDSLPDGGKDILQTGSVIGREFSHSLLEKVMGLPERELISRLSLLKDAEFLYERGVYPQCTYIFKHALIQDTTYQSLMKNTRQKYHEKIAQVLEKHFLEPVETQPELLAYHYTEAGLNEQAVGYWLQAGKHAAQRSANVEAMNYLTKGLEVLMTLPDTLERTRQELALQIPLGNALTALKGYAAPEVGKTYNRARALSRQLGETAQILPSLSGLHRYHIVGGKYQSARGLGEELLQLAQTQADPAVLVAHRAIGSSLFQMGEVGAAREHLEQTLARYKPKQHGVLAFTYGQDIGMVGNSDLGLMLWYLGYPAQAVERFDQALKLAQDCAHALSLAQVLNFGVILHACRRDQQAVNRQAEALIELATEHGLALHLARGTIHQGWVLAMQGSVDEGLAQLQKGLASYRATGAEIFMTYLLALLAEVYGKRGQAEEGLKALDEALAFVEKNSERHFESEIHRLKGELRQKQSYNNVAEAENCFQQARDIARHQQAKSLELRAAMSMSRLWQQQGKRDEARQLLAEIYGWFTEGFDTADLKNAKALLEELSD